MIISKNMPDFLHLRWVAICTALKKFVSAKQIRPLESGRLDRTILLFIDGGSHRFIKMLSQIQLCLNSRPK